MRGLRLIPFALACLILFSASTAVSVRDDVAEPPTPIASVRVVADPVPPPEPVLTRPAAPRVDECPALTNSGGDLKWDPAPDAGPWATDGVVAISSLDVRAPIVRVGVDRRGTMVVPKNARDVAWLDQGGFPGGTNNAVIAGHIAYSRVTGSFNRLEDMREGDEVVVTMDGERWTFEVAFVCLFDRHTAHAERIMGRTEVPSLTLITCGGTFDINAGTHRKRTVVRAELTDVSPAVAA